MPNFKSKHFRFTAYWGVFSVLGDNTSEYTYPEGYRERTLEFLQRKSPMLVADADPARPARPDPHTRVTQRCSITYMIFQEEAGSKNGRYHFQGYIQTSCPVTVDKVRAFFKQMTIPGTDGTPGRQHHVDYCDGDALSNKTYCSKSGEGGRIEGGYFLEEGHFDDTLKGRKESGPGQGSREDISDVYDAIMKGKTWDELLVENFEGLSKCWKVAQDLYTKQLTTRMAVKFQERFRSAELQPWQESVARTFLESEPHSRHVHYIWEDQGGKGKTFLAQYLQATMGALILQVGKKTDLAHILQKSIMGSKLVIFDLTRSSEDTSVKVVWELAESLKDGYLQTTKYDSMSIRFDPKHVLILSNYPEQRNDANGKKTLSADRWQVIHLVDANLTDPAWSN